MSEKKEKEEKEEKSLTEDYEKNKERLRTTNDQLYGSFEEELRKDALKKKKKKKKKSDKELAREAAEKKKEDKEEKGKEDDEDEVDDVSSVRGLMNMLKLRQDERGKKIKLYKLKHISSKELEEMRKQAGKDMAAYLFLTGYAKKKDGSLNEKKMDGEVPEGLFDQKTPEQTDLVDWMVNRQTPEEMEQHMEDMNQLPPGEFYNKMAKDYANHLQAEQQMKNPGGVQVAPAGFHAPDVSPVAAFLARQQQEPGLEAPVLRPNDDQGGQG